MAVKVQLFGQFKQITGSSELEVDAVDTDGLIKEMVLRFPLLKDIPCLIAVDKIIIRSNTSIPEARDLALLPPYSGG